MSCQKRLIHYIFLREILYDWLRHSILFCPNKPNESKLVSKHIFSDFVSLKIITNLLLGLQWSENSCGHYVILPRMPEIKCITD